MSTPSLNLLSRRGVCARLNSATRTAIVSALLVAATASPAQPKMFGLRASSDAESPKQAVTNAIEEASQRFHIPAAWVRAVMRAESDSDAKSVSEKGAIGLMQVMPKTYAELRTKLGLGPDPFDPRDNILAGAAYLADMFDQYGATGFLAAYNAGPRRYEQYLFRGRPLPAETTDYVARLTPQLGLGATAIAQNGPSGGARHTSIFVESSAFNLSNDAPPKSATKSSDQRAQAALHPLFPASPRNNIFAAASHTQGGLKASAGGAPVQPSGLFFARAMSKKTP